MQGRSVSVLADTLPPMPQHTTTRLCPLLQLPPPLLQEHVLPQLPADAKLALFQTCRALLQVVLGHACVSVRLALPAATSRSTATQRAIGLACQHAPDVHLVVDGSACEERTEQQAARLFQSVLHGLNLTPVKTVSFLDLHMAPLMPTWLAEALPQLQSLNTGTWTPPTDACPLAPCSSLQRLQLPVSYSAEGDTLLQTCGLDRQLRALPSLSHLILSPPTGHLEAQACITGIGTQLTYLAVGSWSACQPSLGRHPAKHLPLLRVLNVSQSSIDDCGLHTLLQLPTLTQLHVRSFTLRDSYTDRQAQCHWQVLGVDSFDVAQLVRVPLSSIRTFLLQPCLWSPDAHDSYSVCLSAVPEENQAVADTVVRAGGLQLGPSLAASSAVTEHEVAARVTVSSPWHTDTRCLAALWPLLCSIQHNRWQMKIVVSGMAGLCATQWLAMGAVLQARRHTPPQRTDTPDLQLELSHCVLQEDVWAVLLSSMPGVAVSLYSGGEVSEAQLRVMLEHAAVGSRLTVTPRKRLEQAVSRRVRALALERGVLLVMD